MIIWGRVLDVEVHELLTAIKQEAVVRGRGDYFMKVNDTPNDVVIQCPRYDRHGGRPERTPSCFISKEMGLVHCFGCDYKTTVVGMVTDILGLGSQVEGFQWIRRRFSTPGVGKRRKLLRDELDREKHKIYIPEEALLQYNFDHPYMFARGLTADTVDWFSVGFDKETKSLTFPMRDVDGNIAFIKKRPINREGFGKYIIEEGADKRELLYGLFMIKRCLPKVDMIYLSEGEMDTLSWYSIDRYGVGLQGSELYPEQIRQLIRVARGKSLCIATDNDKAGYKAKRQCIKELAPYFSLYELIYPGDRIFKDPNELLKAGRLDKALIKPITL